LLTFVGVSYRDVQRTCSGPRRRSERL